MKIAIVQYKWAYDREWKPLGKLHLTLFFEYFPLKKVAERHGHTVEVFYIDETIKEHGREGARAKFLEFIKTGKPDVCFAGFNEYDLGKEILCKAKELTTLVSIGDDDAWRWERVSRHFAHCYSWILTYDSRAIKKYQRIGCKNIIHHQPGVDLSVYKKLEGVKKDIDVSFVGLWSKPRQRLIDHLRSNGINIFVRGMGWPEGPISQDELIQTINRSKITLSLNTPAFYFGWRPLVRLFFRRANFGETGSHVKLDIQNLFDNIRMWLMKRNRQVKSRHFEAPACGTFSLTQDADDLRDYLELGKEIVVYENNKDLVDKIKYYLAQEEEREAIAKAGYVRAQRDHSQERRFEDIFRMIGKPL